MRVELYKPIEVEALACLASPSRWIFDHIDSRLVSIPPCTTQLLDDLTTLIIKEKGCLLPLEGDLPTEDQWPPPLADADCTLSLVFEDDKTEEDQMRKTMDSVLEMLDHATAGHNQYEYLKNMFQNETEEKEIMSFQLKCCASGVAMFMQAVSRPYAETVSLGSHMLPNSSARNNHSSCPCELTCSAENYPRQICSVT